MIFYCILSRTQRAWILSLIWAIQHPREVTFLRCYLAMHFFLFHPEPLSQFQSLKIRWSTIFILLVTSIDGFRGSKIVKGSVGIFFSFFFYGKAERRNNDTLNPSSIGLGNNRSIRLFESRFPLKWTKKTNFICNRFYCFLPFHCMPKEAKQFTSNQTEKNFSEEGFFNVFKMAISVITQGLYATRKCNIYALWPLLNKLAKWSFLNLRFLL